MQNLLKYFKKAVKERLRYRQRLPVFGNTQANLSINEPFDFHHPERITFGDDVHIGAGSVIKAYTETSQVMRLPDGSHIEQKFDGKIRFGHRVSATFRLHIGSYDTVTIEDDVMIASNVYIGDGTHGYMEMKMPYKYQGIIHIKPVTLKRGCWIGQNAVIMPGVTIGEMAIVGANSVVNQSIPDRTIAIGSPAEVVKAWNSEINQWDKV